MDAYYAHLPVLLGGIHLRPRSLDSSPITTWAARSCAVCRSHRPVVERVKNPAAEFALRAASADARLVSIESCQ